MNNLNHKIKSFTDLYAWKEGHKLVLNKKKFKKAIFSFSLLILFIGIVFFSLFIFKPETGMSQEPQEPRIIFQEARQWQIAADSPATATLRPESDDVIQLTPNTGSNWDAVNGKLPLTRLPPQLFGPTRPVMQPN